MHIYAEGFPVHLALNYFELPHNENKVNNIDRIIACKILVFFRVEKI